ncbi:patatin-like protein [Amaricoccus sp.]|uniref:patatin-like protein n=1 Tax=Amaricoccus sp. TaxID=1872485 RepID=UPI001B422CCC|nr:patatin-like protein [Amaricoccus sp.]MBP7000684.1 patatin-like protein [Amaricoccus sp.]
MTKATREVRFAVVLYGGTSLAIYMNGISQELLRMVRGGSEAEEAELDEVERIYREIAERLHAITGKLGEDAGPPRPPIRTRFVIDIISGTSAGGINGVALAKALVLGSRNLDVLRKAWTDEATIDKLLNDRRTWRPGRTEAVLDGGHMFDLLHDTLAGMGDAARGRPLVDMVDLFVTATDLLGQRAPVQLTGTSIDERVHKKVFRFSYEADPEDASPGNARVNDFTNDVMLAFAARCTSSFPVAFPPMRLGDTPERLRRGGDFARHFPGDDDYEARVYADGGYLDTKPFSYAIDLIPFRPARLPGERKLLFVDPFPEGRGAKDAAGEVDFVTNAKLAATTLPRREVIREDIRQINAINRRLERLGALQKRWDMERRRHGEGDEPGKPQEIEALYLDDLVKREGYGKHYALYHHLRVYGATDTLSGLVGGLGGIPAESSTAAYLRQLVRAWRDRSFEAYRDKGLPSETVFLGRFDLEFRRRRLTHLRACVDERLAGDGEDAAAWGLWRAIEAELSRLRRLAGPTPSDRAVMLGGIDVAAVERALEAGYPAFAAATDLDGKYRAACDLYDGTLAGVAFADLGGTEAPGKLVNAAMTKLGEVLRRSFDEATVRIGAALEDPALKGLKDEYDRFHWHDMVTFPFLEGTTAEEHGEVQVFRVSPADNPMDRRADKLAGISFGAFGGFLSRDWREHDILWGRLDGAERIVTALMPDPGAAAERAGYVGRLQDAILRQEFGAGSERRRQAMLRRLVGADRSDAIAPLFEKAPPITDRDGFRALYDKPLDPETRELAGWASRAGRILARMLDDLPDSGALAALGRLGRPVRGGSVLAARLTLFATPGGYPAMIAERALLLTLFAGVLMVAISVLVAGSVSIWLGLGFILGAAALWALLHVVGRALRDRRGIPAAAALVAGALVLALAGVGAWSLWGPLAALLGEHASRLAVFSVR